MLLKRDELSDKVFTMGAQLAETHEKEAQEYLGDAVKRMIVGKMTEGREHLEPLVRTFFEDMPNGDAMREPILKFIQHAESQYLYGDNFNLTLRAIMGSVVQIAVRREKTESLQQRLEEFTQQVGNLPDLYPDRRTLSCAMGKIRNAPNWGYTGGPYPERTNVEIILMTLNQEGFYTAMNSGFDQDTISSMIRFFSPYANRNPERIGSVAVAFNQPEVHAIEANYVSENCPKKFKTDVYHTRHSILDRVAHLAWVDNDAAKTKHLAGIFNQPDVISILMELEDEELEITKEAIIETACWTRDADLTRRVANIARKYQGAALMPVMKTLHRAGKSVRNADKVRGIVEAFDQDSVYRIFEELPGKDTYVAMSGLANMSYGPKDKELIRRTAELAFTDRQRFLGFMKPLSQFHNNGYWDAVEAVKRHVGQPERQQMAQAMQQYIDKRYS